MVLLSVNMGIRVAFPQMLLPLKPFEILWISSQTMQQYLVFHSQPLGEDELLLHLCTYQLYSEEYNTVHQKYFEACVASGKRAAKYHSFRNIWLQCLPHIRFMTPRTDVCHHCEDYRVLISKATSEVDKVRLAQEFKEHVELAQKEQQYYLDSMKKAEESVCDGLPSYCHYTFDFAQMLQVPYHACQVGPLFFKVPLDM